jgi:hypothetical protein
MNTVLVLVMLVLIIFALKEGMVWVALGVGLLMVLISTSDSGKKAPERGKFMYPSEQNAPIEGMKEQMLRVKYQPKWDGNNWWEEMADHWGSSMGRMVGLIR